MQTEKERRAPADLRPADEIARGAEGGVKRRGPFGSGELPVEVAEIPPVGPCHQRGDQGA